MSIKLYYDALKKRFSEGGIEAAALDARLVMMHVLGMTHEEFLMQSDAPLGDAQREAIEILAMQRLARKPVAKILGQKEFYGRVFKTTEATLDPRPDSEILVEAILRHAPSDAFQLLDLGTGTGCLLLTVLAECERAQGVAADISLAALAIAQENARRLDLVSRAQFVQSDWFGQVTGRYDVIVSNPPYIPTVEIAGLASDVRDYDPLGALDGGQDGLAPYRLIVARAADFLTPQGLIAFEVGQGQAQDVADMLAAHGFIGIEIVQDLGGIARVVLAKRA